MTAPEPPVDLDDLVQVLQAAKRAGGEWAEVFVERRDNETLRFDSSRVSELRSDTDLGVGVRVRANGRYGMAFTNVLSPDALVVAAQTAAAASGASGGSDSAQSADVRDVRYHPAQTSAASTFDQPAAAKAAVLAQIDHAARDRDATIASVAITLVAVAQDIWVVNTEGSFTADTRVRTRVTCRVTARRDGRVETGFAGPGAGTGMELFELHSPEEIGTAAADRAMRALAGIAPPTGPMPVVLGPSGGGLLLHEACGHGLEADGLSRGSSVYASRFGEQLASPLVSAVDDPTLPTYYGSYGTDDEGTEAGPTTLLDEGVLVGALGARATPTTVANESGANARRESHARAPLARMSNTYIAPGASSPESILGAVARGVYVATLKGGDVNIATGDFAFVSSEAYLIENGERTRSLTGLTLIGNGISALSSVLAVGDDLGFTQALCGKDGQWVPVSYGSPTLLVDGLSVSGGSRG